MNEIILVEDTKKTTKDIIKFPMHMILSKVLFDEFKIRHGDIVYFCKNQIVDYIALVSKTVVNRNNRVFKKYLNNAGATFMELDLPYEDHAVEFILYFNDACESHIDVSEYIDQLHKGIYACRLSRLSYVSKILETKFAIGTGMKDFLPFGQDTWKEELEVGRQKRLTTIAKMSGSSKKITSEQVDYARSQEIRIEKLYESNGRCMKCGNVAPFFSKDGLPYLEVHHVIPLSSDGEDTLENTIALCPNCHRKIHYQMETDYE